jgi:hypothetical protein
MMYLVKKDNVYDSPFQQTRVIAFPSFGIFAEAVRLAISPSCSRALTRPSAPRIVRFCVLVPFRVLFRSRFCCRAQSLPSRPSSPCSGRRDLLLPALFDSVSSCPSVCCSAPASAAVHNRCHHGRLHHVQAAACSFNDARRNRRPREYSRFTDASRQDPKPSRWVGEMEDCGLEPYTGEIVVQVINLFIV